MRDRRTAALVALIALVTGACSGTTPSSVPIPESASPAPTTAVSPSPSASASAEASAKVSPSAAPASPTPLPADPAEAVIQDVESGATITFWTFYLSPDYDDYIKETIARFEATYPGVSVRWQDHQASFQQDLNAAFADDSAPDVINLSVSEGWVSDYAGKGLLLGLDDKVPQAVKSAYFPNLWDQQLVDGVDYQFPWYQGLNVELINTQIMDKAGLSVDRFPKTIDGLPGVCRTVFEATSDLCAIRLTMTDLLAQMAFEGGVKIFGSDGRFAFDSADGVAWLQMYVDMVKAGVLDTTVLTGDDRVGLNAFSAGAAPFYATGPNLASEVKDTNATLYANLAMVPTPLGKSGVAGKGLMSISVSKSTKDPNASIALAQFFTNPRSMVEFAKLGAIYPSSPKAFDDPFFSSTSSPVGDSLGAIARDTIATYQDIVPTVPHKADVNGIVSKAIQSALFGGVPAQQALEQAVTDANKLLSR